MLASPRQDCADSQVRTDLDDGRRDAGVRLYPAGQRPRQARHTADRRAGVVGAVPAGQRRDTQAARGRAVRQGRSADRLPVSARGRRGAGADSFPGDQEEDRFADHQPRWPWRVGRRGGRHPRRSVAAAGARTVRPGRFRPARGGIVAARDLVQLRRRERPSAHRTPGRLQPEGVAHIEGETKAYVGRCFHKMGKDVPRECRNRQRRQGPRRDPRGGGRREADLPRLLVRHPDRLGVRRSLPAATCGR